MNAVLPALFVPGIGAFLAFVVFRESSAAPFIFGASKIFLLAWPAFWVLGVERRSPQDILGPPRGLIRGCLIGAFFAFLILLGWNLGLDTMLAEHRHSVIAAVGRWGSSEYFWAWALFMSLIHSTIEELYWRGFIFTRLSKIINSGAAVIISSMCFGIHHGVLYAVTLDALSGAFLALAVALGGGAWCLVYREENSLWAPWISHVIADLTIFAIGAHFLRS